MSLDLLILRAINEYGWSRNFATEYVMGKHIHGLGHGRAYAHAMKSPYVRASEKPRSR
jgi:hypothetical protein